MNLPIEFFHHFRKTLSSWIVEIKRCEQCNHSAAAEAFGKHRCGAYYEKYCEICRKKVDE